LKLERALEILKVKRIDSRGSRIHFTTSVLRNNLLGPIGSGDLSVQPEGGGLVVIYQLRFTRLLMTVTVMLFGFVGFIAFNAHLSSADTVFIFCVFWMWFFGGNVLLALIRFPRWLRRTLA